MTRRKSRHSNRVLATLALVTAWIVAAAGPALAHGRGGDATNFSSEVTSTPEIHGVAWRVIGGDEYLWVENRSGAELAVPGYEGEPYLRVGADGVFRNRNSPATYVNQDRLGRVTPPPNADADAEPAWEKVSDGQSWYWHDHRIHYMNTGLPPQVEDPGASTVVFPWTVPFSLDGERYEVQGVLRWVPGPEAWPWLLAGLVLSLPALAGLRSRPPEWRVADLARPAAAVLGGVSALNLVHLVDDLFAAPAPLSATALAAVQTVLFIGIGVFGVVRGWQGGDGAFTALGIGAGAVLAGQGVLYAPVLTASQVTSVFPDAVGRLAVGWSIAQALPVGIVSVVGTRRLLPPPDVAEDEASAVSTA